MVEWWHDGGKRSWVHGLLVYLRFVRDEGGSIDELTSWGIEFFADPSLFRDAFRADNAN